MRLTGLLLLLSGVLYLSAGVPRIEIILDQDSIDLLETDPFDDDAEVRGDVVINSDTVFSGVDIHYRGAYYLFQLIEYKKKQRNWKLKFDKEHKYRNRREWNYNYEPHQRQKTCYDIFNAAGVTVPSARHVELFLNGDSHGPYLEYEDPDDKQWLLEKFGDNSGDLYKAAYDKPDEQSYFALLTDLGDSSSNYYMHFTKKTNENGADSLDYQSLVKFIKMINTTPDREFPDTLQNYFEVDAFLKYLVIVNFTVNWDSYPTRPKNYWLYHNPSTGKWTFIPWDLDLTFQRKRTGDIILDTDLSIFYQLDAYEIFKGQENEGTERPLVRRMMKLGDFRDRYIREYRTALVTYLQIDSILAGIDVATVVVEEILQNDGDELEEYLKGVANLKTFIKNRYQHVSSQLSALRIHNDWISRNYNSINQVPPFLVRLTDKRVVVATKGEFSGSLTISINDLLGRELFFSSKQCITTSFSGGFVTTPQLPSGTYLVRLTGGGINTIVTIVIQ